MNIGVVCYLMIFTKDQIFQNNGGKNYFLVRFSILLGLRVNGPLRQEKLSHDGIFRSAEPSGEKRPAAVANKLLSKMLIVYVLFSTSIDNNESKADFHLLDNFSSGVTNWLK